MEQEVRSFLGEGEYWGHYGSARKSQTIPRKHVITL